MATRPSPENVLDLLQNMERRLQRLETSTRVTYASIAPGGAIVVLNESDDPVLRIGTLTSGGYGIEQWSGTVWEALGASGGGGAGDTASTANTLGLRDANGDLAVDQIIIDDTAPTAVNHGTRKDYVDGRLPGRVRFGAVSITPVANTPTAQAIAFGITYSSAPQVFVTAVSAVPGTQVVEVSAANITTTGCDIYIDRTNTTATSVQWLSIGP